MLRTTRKCLGKKSRNVVQMRFKTDQLQDWKKKRTVQEKSSHPTRQGDGESQENGISSRGRKGVISSTSVNIGL